uniref:Uncharacterized protein n=1 Tax=Cacopsylla melanoneura TaxID=428564 RepID=A0A8D8PK39_9HEMI
MKIVTRFNWLFTENHLTNIDHSCHILFLIWFVSKKFLGDLIQKRILYEEIGSYPGYPRIWNFLFFLVRNLSAIISPRVFHFPHSSTPPTFVSLHLFHSQ